MELPRNRIAPKGAPHNTKGVEEVVQLILLARNELGEGIVGVEGGAGQGEMTCLLGASGIFSKLYCYDKWEDFKQVTKFKKLQERYPVIEMHPRPAHASLDDFEFVNEIMGEIDFVYLGSNRSYSSVRAGIETWAPRLGEGGIISGRGFEDSTVQKAVEDGLKLKQNEVQVLVGGSWVHRVS